MKRIYTRTGDKGTTGIHGGERVPKDDIRIEANGTLDELNCHLGVVRSLLRSGQAGQEKSEPSFPSKDQAGHGKSEPSFPSKGQAGQEKSEPSFPSKGQAGHGNSEPSFPSKDQAGQEKSEKMRREDEVDALLHEIQENLMVVMSQVATPAAKREQNPNPLPEHLVEDCEAQMDAISERIGAGAYFLLPGGTPVSSHLQLARAVCRRAERLLWTLNRHDPVPDEILRYINRLSDLLFVLAREDMSMQEWPEERWKEFTYKNRK